MSHEQQVHNIFREVTTNHFDVNTIRLTSPPFFPSLSTSYREGSFSVGQHLILARTVNSLPTECFAPCSCEEPGFRADTEREGCQHRHNVLPTTI